MAHRHPWDPGYALPANVLAEPPGNRGSRITAQMPRKTYDGLVPYQDAYALPNYLEHPGTEAIYSRPLPRKWYPGPMAISMPGLGDTQAGMADLSSFGQQAATALLADIGEVPPSGRLFALRLALNAIEPGLYDRFLAKLQIAQKGGLAGTPALHQALAQATAEGFAKELIALGKGKKPAQQSLMGLGYYGTDAAYASLDGFWSAVATPFKAIYKGVKKVVTSKPVKWIAAGATVIFPVAALGFGAPAIAPKETLAIAKIGVKYAGKAIGAVAGVACKVLSSPAAPLIGGAAAAAYGAPPQIGAMGAQIGQSLCPHGTEPIMEPPPPPPSTFPWGMLAIGGGALAIILIATSKKPKRAETAQ